MPADDEGESAALEAAIRRANEAPTDLTGEDVGTVLARGTTDAIQFVCRAFLQSQPEPPTVRTATRAAADRLDDDEELRRSLAVTLLADLAVDHPSIVAEVSEELRAGLEMGPAVSEPALRALANVAETAPEAVVPVLDDAVRILRTGIGEESLHAATIIEEVAAVEPSAVADHLDTLLDVVGNPYDRLEPGVAPTGMAPTDQSTIEEMREADWEVERDQTAARRHTAAAIRTAAREAPTVIADRIDEVIAVIRSTDPDSAVRGLVETVGTVGLNHPAVFESTIEVMAELLEADDPTVAGAAAWTLGVAAESHPDRVRLAVREHLDSLRSLLTARNETVRARTAGLFAYLAESDPAHAVEAAPELREALEDRTPEVRWAAVSALGFLEAVDIDDQLATLQAEDPDEDVREAARRALERRDG